MVSVVKEFYVIFSYYCSFRYTLLFYFLHAFLWLLLSYDTAIICLIAIHIQCNKFCNYFFELTLPWLILFYFFLCAMIFRLNNLKLRYCWKIFCNVYLYILCLFVGYEAIHIHVTTFSLTHSLVLTNHTKAYNRFFFYLGFLSWTFTNHRSAGEGGGHFFISSLPLPPASQTLRQ